MKDETILRVEVKSLNMQLTGPSFGWPTNDQWDMLLVVDTESFRTYEFKVEPPDVIVDKLRVYTGYKQALRHPEYEG